MNDAKYIGLDVHQATISVVVLDSTGHLVMESIIETKAATILQLLHGLSGSLHVTFEEGTCAAWLHDLLKPHVARVLVCDPRKNALLKAGNKNDRIDARKLADLLRSGLLSPVYHGENGVRVLKELARSYLTLTRDTTRVMNRLKAALSLLGLENSFDFIVDSSGFSKPKPDPEVFERAILGLGMSAEECLVIEDSLNGILAAKAAGCIAAAILTSFTKQELASSGADFVVDNFEQIRALIETCESG